MSVNPQNRYILNKTCDAIFDIFYNDEISIEDAVIHLNYREYLIKRCQDQESEIIFLENKIKRLEDNHDEGCI